MPKLEEHHFTTWLPELEENPPLSSDSARVGGKQTLTNWICQGRRRAHTLSPDSAKIWGRHTTFSSFSGRVRGEQTFTTSLPKSAKSKHLYLQPLPELEEAKSVPPDSVRDGGEQTYSIRFCLSWRRAHLYHLTVPELESSLLARDFARSWSRANLYHLTQPEMEEIRVLGEEPFSTRLFARVGTEQMFTY